MDMTPEQVQTAKELNTIISSLIDVLCERIIESSGAEESAKILFYEILPGRLQDRFATALIQAYADTLQIMRQREIEAAIAAAT